MRNAETDVPMYHPYVDMILEAFPGAKVVKHTMNVIMDNEKMRVLPIIKTKEEILKDIFGG